MSKSLNAAVRNFGQRDQLDNRQTYHETLFVAEKNNLHMFLAAACDLLVSETWPKGMAIYAPSRRATKKTRLIFLLEWRRLRQAPASKAEELFAFRFANLALQDVAHHQCVRGGQLGGL